MNKTNQWILGCMYGEQLQEEKIAMIKVKEVRMQDGDVGINEDRNKSLWDA